MNILKKVIIALLIVIAIPLVVALFIKKDYHIQREIVINKPSEEVFEYIKYVKNQDNFSVWNQMDPDMEKNYSGEDGTVGFTAAWKSDNKDVGAGSQTIVAIEEGKKIETRLKFIEPFEAEDDAYFTTTPIDETSTHVVWGFSGAFPYPFNLMKLFFNMDEMIGADLEEGLQNLKKLLEEN
jgi:hypothetical protein